MPDIPSTFKLNTLAPDTGKQVGYVIVCGQQVGKQGENECEFDVDCKLKVKIAVSSYTFQEISADFYLKWSFTFMIHFQSRLRTELEGSKMLKLKQK